MPHSEWSNCPAKIIHRSRQYLQPHELGLRNSRFAAVQSIRHSSSAVYRLSVSLSASGAIKVATGEHTTESEVIRDGLRALLARDRAMEDWLCEQVIPAAHALKAEPGRALSVG